MSTVSGAFERVEIPSTTPSQLPDVQGMELLLWATIATTLVFILYQLKGKS